MINQDSSIWASAWCWKVDDFSLRAGGQGIKIGWFRPEGANLETTGRLLGNPAAAIEAHVPCCYPTRFQSSGITFPEPGCWEITATAGNEELSFTVLVEP